MLWSSLTRPVLSKAEAGTFAMKLIVEPGEKVLGAGQNWSNVLEIESVTVARSAFVGTRVVLTVGATWRKPSQDTKKNVLSRMMGPPRVGPYWFRCSVYFVPPSLFLKKSAPSIFELLQY